MVEVGNLYSILVILFVAYILWEFGHKEEWGALLKNYKYEGTRPSFHIKNKTIHFKFRKTNKWTPIATVDLSFNENGIIISNHTFLFQKLMPMVKVPWEKIKFLGEKRHWFFKGAHIRISAIPDVEIILPKTSKKYIEKYVTI